MIPIPQSERLTVYPFNMDKNPIYYVYVHLDYKGTPFYVGKGKGRRAWNKRVRNPYWRYVSNLGYSIKILEENLNEEWAFIRELYYIEKYMPRTNFQLGPRGTISGCKRSQKTKEKVASACKKAWTIEKRLFRKNEYTGKNNPFYGKKHTEEVKSKLRKYHFKGIECQNLLTGECFLVSGTRNASLKTKVPRQTIMRLLNHPPLNQKIRWKFRRI